MFLYHLALITVIRSFLVLEPHLICSNFSGNKILMKEFLIYSNRL